MSNIDEFPKNPKDGDKFVSSDGIEYVYQKNKKNDGDAIICPLNKKSKFNQNVTCLYIGECPEE